MNDRFKFRIWDKKLNKLSKWGDNPYHNMEIMNYICIEEPVTDWKHEDYVLMQCTGLIDKNGTLIYEGDIVKITKEDWKGEKYSRIFLICWDMTQWQLGLLKYQRPKAQANRRSDRTFPFKNIVSFDDYTPKKSFAQCEVIGNYYENKELLESEG